MGAGNPLLHFILLLSRSGHRPAQVSSTQHCIIPLRLCDWGSLSLLSLAFRALLAILRVVFPPHLC